MKKIKKKHNFFVEFYSKNGKETAKKTQTLWITAAKAQKCGISAIGGDVSQPGARVVGLPQTVVL